MRARRRSFRTAHFAALCIALVLALLASMSPAVAAPSRWELPVAGSVVRPFRAPLAQYASGHRGIDLAAPAGTSVRAANDGVVVFAGSVAGSLHVVVAHDGGIRTSSSFLARVDVRVGQRVSRGTAIGAAGGAGDGHGAGILHFGVRVGERYVDPMLLFGPTDLTEVVRLVPVSARGVADATSTAAEERVLAAEFLREWKDEEGCAGALGEVGLGIGWALNGACDGLTGAVDAGLDGMRWVGAQAAAVAAGIADVVAATVERIVSTGEGILAAAAAVAGAAADAVVAVVKAVARAGAAVIEWLTSCPQPMAKRHGKGSGNLAMVVAGQSSSRHRRADGSLAPSMPVDRQVLGYGRRDLTYFSYDPTAPTYEKADTLGDLHAQARSLATQLRDVAQRNPGRSIDLLGHSQGGVVIALFLAEHYRGHEDEFPPIPNVVTFASPLEGTPWATWAKGFGDTAVGQGAYGLADRFMDDLPLDTVALDQLAEDSPTIGSLQRAPAPRPRFLSIVGAADPVVPSSSGDLDGATKVVVTVGDVFDFWKDHSGILHDDDALSAAQAHLAGGAPSLSCGPLTDVAGERLSEAIRLGAIALDQPLNPQLEGIL